MNIYVKISDENSRIILKDICFKCGSHCCKLGGAIATQNELDAITKHGYPNHFVQLSKDVYGTEWGKDGICPYLENERCSIYSVRPSGCRLFPVVQTQNSMIVLFECPLSSHISDGEIVERKRILTQRPAYIVKESEHLRQNHTKDLRMRATRYVHHEI